MSAGPVNTPTGMPASGAGQPAPLVRVLRGRPGPVEIAALVAVLTARARAGAPTRAARAHQHRSAWADPAWLLARSPRPGPDGWRRCALPR